MTKWLTIDEATRALEVCSQGQQLLNDVAGAAKLVAVLGSAGTAKSFLSNAIATLFQRQYLEVPDSVGVFLSRNSGEPVTAGVDIYRHATSDFIVADIEGLNVADELRENKLVSLPVLAAHCNILNVCCSGRVPVRGIFLSYHNLPKSMD